MKAKSFDRRFEAGEELTEYLDLAKGRRANRKQRRVNVDIPEWMINALDDEAARLGVTRESVIKVWLAERLERAPR